MCRVTGECGNTGCVPEERDGTCDCVKVIYIYDDRILAVYLLTLCVTLFVCLLKVTDGPHKLQYGVTL